VSEVDTPDALVSSSLYERIRDDLVHGRILSGTLLPEASLARRYEASRTPVREVLIRLENDGLVERAARGFRVRRGSATDILEIYGARIALETLAAQGAAIRHTELELARLQLLHEQALAASEEREMQELHSRWHRALWSAAHNATVTGILNRLSHQLRVIDEGNHRQGVDHGVSNDEHTAILRAIESNDAAAAGEAIARHLTRTREARVRAFAALGL